MTNLPAIPSYRGPAAAPSPNDPSPSRGGPSVPHRGGSADDLSLRRTPGADVPRLVRTMSLPSLPTRESRQIADRSVVLRDAVVASRSESSPFGAGALNAAFAALPQLPAHERAEELRALMQPFAQMVDQGATEQERYDAALQLYTAAPGLDSAPRGQLLTLIAARIDRMPAAERAEVFMGVTADSLALLSKADMLAPLQALAGQLHAHPKDDRYNVMGVLAFQNQNNTQRPWKDKALDPPDQARLLAALAQGVGSTHDPLMAFDFLRGRTLEQPAEHRLPSVVALSQQVDALPLDERLGSVWALRQESQGLHAEPLFADRLALGAVGSLPERHRAPLLMAIIEESAHLPQAHRSILLGEVHQAVANAAWSMAGDVRQMLKAAAGSSS